jgi:hypothetical protein
VRSRGTGTGDSRPGFLRRLTALDCLYHGKFHRDAATVSRFECVQRRFVALEVRSSEGDHVLGLLLLPLGDEPSRRENGCDFANRSWHKVHEIRRPVWASQSGVVATCAMSAIAMSTDRIVADFTYGPSRETKFGRDLHRYRHRLAVLGSGIPAPLIDGRYGGFIEPSIQALDDFDIPRFPVLIDLKRENDLSHDSMARTSAVYSE